MTTDEPPPVTLWCGACRTESVAVEMCPGCGLALLGPVADRLRDIERRRYEIGELQRDLAAEAHALIAERAHLAGAAAPQWSSANGASPSRNTATRGEFRPEVVFTVLLWLGATLVVLATVTFIAVTWTHLGKIGRVELLATLTGLVTAGAVVLRRRLPTTADVLYVLATALLLVAWHALRGAGLGDGLHGITWWAIGAAVAGGTAAYGGQVLRLPATRNLAAALAMTSLGLAVVVARGPSWRFAVILSLVATGVAHLRFVAIRSALWNGGPAAILSVGVGVAQSGAVLAILNRIDLESAGTWRAALAVSMVALLPVSLVGAHPRLRATLNGDWLMALATAAIIATPLVWMRGHVDGRTVAIVSGILGLVAMLPGLGAPGQLTNGMTGAGTAIVAGSAATALEAVFASVALPLGRLNSPWTATAWLRTNELLRRPPVKFVGVVHVSDAILCAIVAAGAAMFATRRGDRETNAPSSLRYLATSGAAAAIATLFVALHTPISVATFSTLTLALLCLVLGPRAAIPGSIELGVAVALVPVVGETAASRSLTFAVLILAVCGATSLAILALDTTRRGIYAAIAVGAASGTVATAAAIFGADARVVSFTAVCVASIVVSLAAWTARSPATRAGLAIAAVATTAIATALGWSVQPHGPWSAGSLTVAAAGLVVASLREHAYRPLAPFVTLLATWTWLAAGNVHLVEAYTLPATIAMLFVGHALAGSASSPSSWLRYGPALTLALLPSLAVTLQHATLPRSVALSLAGFAVVIVGTRHRLQAPIVLGAATLVALGVDMLAPVAARTPRWVVLAIGGVALLWLGATAERRVTQLRTIRDDFARLH